MLCHAVFAALVLTFGKRSKKEIHHTLLIFFWTIKARWGVQSGLWGKNGI